MASKRATRWIDSLISLGVGTGGQAIMSIVKGAFPSRKAPLTPPQSEELS